MPIWYRFILYALVAAAAICAGIYIFVLLDTQHSIKNDIADLPKTQAALLLGASVASNGALSAVLQARADAAIMLYKSGKVSKILVTGDNSTLAHNEVNPVGKYLESKGIPEADIFLDHAGFDTYSSVYRARDIFKIDSLTVVSQSFHLPRAVFVAHSLGLTAYGFEAPGPGLFIYNWLREVPATTKALFDILSDRIPKYLGPSIPISGGAQDLQGIWK